MKTSPNPPALSQQTFQFSMPAIQPINDDNSAAGISTVIRKNETVLQRFLRFHERNPHVYDLIVDISKRMKQSGVHRFGMKGIFEYLRWQYSMQTRGDRYKLDNIYTAPYARMVMERERELGGFFETRRRVTE